MVKRHHIYIKLCVVAIAMLLLSAKLFAQDTTYVDAIELYSDEKVRWVNQIPSLKEDEKKLKKGWLKKLLFGKNGMIDFQKPVNIIAMDPDNCIVFDQGNGTIFLTEDGKLKVPKVLRKKETYYPSLVGACLLPGNKVLFTDSKLNKIFEFSENKKQITELNKELLLSQPTGIAFSVIKNQIWVIETKEHRINILDINGKHVRTFGTRGKGEGEFNFPTSIWIDKNGLAYVVDALNYRVQIFDSEGNFVSMFGENGNGTGYMASPKGIATDSQGNIYVVDALFHSVQIFNAKGDYLYQFGKQGSEIEQFWMPSGIFIDSRDYIYVSDSYNNRIQIFELIHTQ
jgi:DNA-binding beta-propeller fold protein YncE